jgi:REP element-mobilizing transposase RayT
MPAKSSSTNKYRRSIRMQGYDYRLAGAYFVTIVTQARAMRFGSVDDRGEVSLSPDGECAAAWLAKIPVHFPGAAIPSWVVMPNHIHMVVVIDNEPVGAGSRFIAPCKGSPRPYQKTAYTLGQIIGYYKYQTTKAINLTHGTPGERIWQRNYYEHIIRTEDEMNRISDYILTNPLRWQTDRENPDAASLPTADAWQV